MWFKELTGFEEQSADEVRQLFSIEGASLRSLVNGRSFRYGQLEIPSLQELRAQTKQLAMPKGKMKLQEYVGDIKDIHLDAANANALIQVASQFNLLEMVNSDVTPETGIDQYEFDQTQGPVCAIACGAGTIWRNYFVEVSGKHGQSADRQIDTMKDMGIALGNGNGSLWKMENGYLLPSREGLLSIQERLSQSNPTSRDALKQLYRVGIQWNTEVTLDQVNHNVTQVYCSAIPVVTDTGLSETLWEPFARLVLEAAYEATLHAALLNLDQTGNNKVYLTLVGGGAFNNRSEWIYDALKMVLERFSIYPLDVSIVSYQDSKPEILSLIEDILYSIQNEIN
jgi:hypothetical protein